MKFPENECPPFFNRYLDPLPENVPVQELLTRQVSELDELLSSISDQQADFRYAPEKWSVKEVLGHLVDGERVFAYRAMCIARGEQQSLPGFDENEYVRQADYSACTLNDLLVEFLYVRKSSLSLLHNTPEHCLKRVGTANNHAVSPRVLFYVMAGHLQHHLMILRERYLPALPGPTTRNA